MKPDPLVETHLDARDVAQGIITENYREITWPSVALLAERARAGFWRLLDEGLHREQLTFPPEEYAHDERGDELEIGLLPKRTGEHKSTLSAQEIAEGRLYADGNKWRFHFGDELYERLRGDSVLLSDYRDFFSACRRINMRAKMIAYAVASAIDKLNVRNVNYPGSLKRQVAQGKAFTRLLRYEDSGASKLVVFDHAGKAAYPDTYEPRRILVFPGIKFWGVTRGRYGAGTVHGVCAPEQKRFDASLHRDRDCLTIHWLSRSDADRYRFAMVSFVHCALTPADVDFMRRNLSALAIDSAQYYV